MGCRCVVKLPLVLFVTHVVPWPPAAGNELRVYKLIKWFRARGFRVILVLNCPVTDAVKVRLEMLVDKLHCQGDATGPSVRGSFGVAARYMWLKGKALLRSRQGVYEPSMVGMLCPSPFLARVMRVLAFYKPEVVIAEYIGMSPCLDVASRGTFKLIDTIDVFSTRQHKVLIHDIADPFACSEEQERHCLLRADVVLAIQQDEATLLRRMVPGREVITVEVDPDSAAEPAPSVGKVVFIAASGNPQNVHGVKAFLLNTWPAIRLHHPDASLRIAGRVCDELDDEIPGVERLGYVEDLGLEYERACVVVNPVVAGTGLKIKSIEALARGKCLISMPNGVEGIIWEGDAPFVECQTWGAMAESVILLLSDERARIELACRARNYAQVMYNPEKVYQELQTCLCKRGILRERTNENCSLA